MEFDPLFLLHVLVRPGRQDLPLFVITPLTSSVDVPLSLSLSLSVTVLERRSARRHPGDESIVDPVPSPLFTLVGRSFDMVTYIHQGTSPGPPDQDVEACSSHGLTSSGFTWWPSPLAWDEHRIGMIGASLRLFSLMDLTSRTWRSLLTCWGFASRTSIEST